MMDEIRIVDLEVFANHGVFPEENALGQKFVVSLALHGDFSAACHSDSLDDSVDYGAVCHEVDAVLRGNTFKLIERAAQAVADAVLEKFPLVQAVDVELKKPWAPIGLPVAYAAVKISRSR